MSDVVTVDNQPTKIPASPGNIAVTVRGLTKTFGHGENKVFALRGVDVEIGAGEMTLLVGPSGCGKTTLISVVAGLLEPTEGHVQVLGKDLESLSNSELVRFRGSQIGFIFQQYNLLPALTSAENASVPLIISGVPRKQAVEKAKHVLESVGLGNRLNAFPSQLSGGQQQRVAIARALVHEPRLLVCDEPTAALDAHSGRTVMELLRAVAIQPDRAVVVVTHDSRVFDFGDRIIYMSDGSIDRIETPKNEKSPS